MDKSYGDNMRMFKRIKLLFMMSGIVVLLACCIAAPEEVSFVTDGLDNHNSSKEKTLENECTLVVYVTDDGKNWGARRLYADFSEGKLSLSEENVFSIYSSNGYTDSIYPVHFKKDYLVLKQEPSFVQIPEYIVDNDDNTLWQGAEKLEYDQANDRETLYEGVEKKGRLEGLRYENTSLVPIAFLTQDDMIYVLCSRNGDDMPSIWENPIISVSAKMADSEEYNIIDMHSYEQMFGEQLSVLQMPYYIDGTSNVVGICKTGKFYWNEGRSIVEIDPKTGDYRVLITEDDVSNSISILDTTRESYGFFQKIGWQNDRLILTFPNYNNTEGVYAAIYDENNSFVGSVMISDDSIIMSDKNNFEIDRINVKNLQPFVYIPQG